MALSAKVDAIRVRPIFASYWIEPDDPGIEAPRFAYAEDLTDASQLRRLTEAVRSKHTVWIETYLDGLHGHKREWFEGQYDVWKSMENPQVDWQPMKDVLKAVRLKAPSPTRRRQEKQQVTLLRALPYAYTQGTFGIMRDALSSGAERPDPDTTQLTIFPFVGFQPERHKPDADQTSYVANRAVVAVIGSVVISMRLPNLRCAPEVGESEYDAQGARSSLKVPRRFLPLHRSPTAHDIAEGIGIHQATTVRGISNEIRQRLSNLERKAQRLNSPDGVAKRGSQSQDDVRKATEEIDRQADLVQTLDRQIAIVLRRMGGSQANAVDPASVLVPNEVRRRYAFALDELRSLREDCRLTAAVAHQALAIYEQRLHERFQGFATVLASAVLIPTLLVGIFGVSVKVPAAHSSHAFPALVGGIAVVGASAYVAFQTAHDANWKRRPKEMLLPAVIALLGLTLLAAALWHH